MNRIVSALYVCLTAAVAMGQTEPKTIASAETTNSRKHSADRRPAVGLTTGVSQSFSLPAVNQPTLFAGDYSHVITVPPGAATLTLTVTTSTPGLDLDVFGRYGKDVELMGGRPVSDHSSQGPTGNETITIHGPRAGQWFFAYAVFTLGVRANSVVLATVGVSGCEFALSTTSVSLPAAGGSGSVNLQTSGTCAWTASSDSSWLNVVGAASGSGPSNIAFRATANTSAARTARLDIAGLTFSVNQEGTTITPTSDPLVVPQFVSGGGWGTQLFLTNLSAVTERFEIRFYRADGTRWQVAISGRLPVASVSGSLNGGETLVLETSDGGPLEQGWAAIVPATATASRLSGFAVFRSRVPSQPDSEATVPLTATTARNYVLVYDNTIGFETGVAAVNPGNNPVSIVAVVRDDMGRTLDNQRIELPAQGQIAFALSERMKVTANRKGTVHLSAPSGVAGLGLRFSPSRSFTSFGWLTSPDIQR